MFDAVIKHPKNDSLRAAALDRAVKRLLARLGSHEQSRNASSLDGAFLSNTRLEEAAAGAARRDAAPGAKTGPGNPGSSKQ
jgi:hypothetical protein